MADNHAIIVAAGKGQRMGGGDVPKPFLLIAGAPIILHTLKRFIDAMPGIILTVVLPRDYFGLWHQMLLDYKWKYPVIIAEGGPERFHSVKSGLATIGNAEFVAIHDAVRPLVSSEVIQNGFIYASRHGAAVPCLPSNESMRLVDGALNKPVNRDNYRLLQTPQVFKASILLDAYRQSFTDLFTDDASVVESAGYPIRLFEGNRENIKITQRADLAIAEALLKIND